MKRAALVLVLPTAASAQEGLDLGLFKSLEKYGIKGPIDPSRFAGQCNFSNLPGIVWWGTEDQMTVQRIAELAGQNPAGPARARGA